LFVFSLHVHRLDRSPQQPDDRDDVVEGEKESGDLIILKSQKFLFKEIEISRQHSESGKYHEEHHEDLSLCWSIPFAHQQSPCEIFFPMCQIELNVDGGQDDQSPSWSHSCCRCTVRHEHHNTESITNVIEEFSER